MTELGPWPRWNMPADARWSADALAAARAYAATIHTSAAMLVAGGRVVDAWGETARRWNVHSIRKSLISARSGVYHPSGDETDWMVSINPARGTAGPGTTSCYNKWDFNALEAVFVHGVDTDTPGQEVTAAQFGRLLHLVLDAAPSAARG